MCVSLLERVKQGKSNIILILILSARSQDRDTVHNLVLLDSRLFQSTRSQDRDLIAGSCLQMESNISIHSVARPRRDLDYPYSTYARKFQSTRSQDRDISSRIPNMRFNVIFQSTRSQDRDKTFDEIWESTQISIHSVARPRLIIPLFNPTSIYFNPLGRKTETKILLADSVCRIFQSTRSQDRDIALPCTIRP